MTSIAALQTVYSCLWNARYSYFLKTGITESVAPTECLTSYSFGKEIIVALCSLVIKPMWQHKCSNIGLITTADSKFINTMA